jgi:hypothetical protein
MFKWLFNKGLRSTLSELNDSHDNLIDVLENMNKRKSGAKSKEDLLKF